MKLRYLAVGLLCAGIAASDIPRGTVPRAAADKYPAHAEQEGATLGAMLLTSRQARKALAIDMDRCCLVIEAAFYPSKDSQTKVSLNDFALRIQGQDIALKPSSAEVVASKLQIWSQPQPPGPDVSGSVGVGIGYENGTDPVTGQRRSGHTVTTGASVGIGIGGEPQPRPAPAEAEMDRHALELELRELSLPEGDTATPVSGYLYFSTPQKKKAKYQLEYVLNGNKVTLALR